MTILLSVLAAAVAAFCVWLTARIMSRRERWAQLAILLVSIVATCADTATAEESKKTDAKESPPSKVVAKDLSEWQLSMNLGSDGPERKRIGWYEIDVSSDRRCKIQKVTRREMIVLFDDKLPEEELQTVLDQVCNAINNGPPKRKQAYWYDGMRIDVKLKTPMKEFNSFRDGLHADGFDQIPDDAGPEIQKLVKLFNGHLPWAKAERMPLKGHAKPVVASGLSADGKFLATGSYDRTLRIWSILERKQQQVRTYAGIPRPRAFSADGTKVFVFEQFSESDVQWDEFSVLDLGSGQESSRLFSRQTPRGIHSLSPDGRWLIVSPRGAGPLELWDVSSGQKTGDLQGSARGVIDAFSHDTRRFVASSSEDGDNRGSKSCRLLEWNVEKWESKAEGALVPQAPYRNFDGRQRGGEIGHITHLAFSPDGRSLAVSGLRYGRRYPDECPDIMYLLDTETRQARPYPRLILGNRADALTYSPDGEMLAIATEARSWLDHGDWRTLFVGTANGTSLAEDTERGVLSPVFSNDGRVFAAAIFGRNPGLPGELRIWTRSPDAEKQPFRLQTVEKEIILHTQIVRDNQSPRMENRVLRFTPDGRSLIITVPMRSDVSPVEFDYVNVLDVSRYARRAD